MVCLKEFFISILYILLIFPREIWTSVRPSERETQSAKDFHWSAWSEFSPCSRSCGVGIKRRYRTCYRFGPLPTPVDGELCRGDGENYHTCNVKECPEGSVDFRRLQCAYFDGLSHNNRKHSWKPFMTDKLSQRSRSLLNPCSLVCSAVGVAGLVVKFTPRVVDGTSCNQGNARQVCVNGQCQTLGCDDQLDSGATYDRCGVCNGDGTSCDVISGSISQVLYTGYRTLLEIEAGTRNTQIRQTSGPEATVAVKSSAGIFFLIDVNRRERLSGTKAIGGTVIYYKQSQNGGPSSLRWEGPNSERLDILGFTLEQHSSIDIEYEFTRQTGHSDSDVMESTSQEESYDWETLLYQHVSSVKGFPVPPRPVTDDVTSSNSSERVFDVSSVTSTAKLKVGTTPGEENGGQLNFLSILKETTTEFPVVITSTLKTQASPRSKIRKRLSRRRKIKLRKKKVPKFLPEGIESDAMSSNLISDDNTDSHSAHTSENSARTLGIDISVRSGERQVDVTEEGGGSFYRRTDSSDGYEWRRNTITPCSSTCSFGTQISLFRCERHDGVQVNESLCDISLRPSPTYHECGRKRCQPRWVTGPWAPCSRTCGGGESVRSVRCWQMLAPGFDSTVHAYLCDLRAEPMSSRRCGEIPCGPQWEVSQWQECSSKCGHGFQTRHVRCSSGSDVYCSARSRSSSKRSCHQATCTNQWYTVSWSPCSGPCGRGTRQRHVGCRDQQGRLLAENFCDPGTKPLSTIACGESLYCPPTWVAQPWGSCNMNCGTGEATRKLICGSVVGGKFRLQSDVNCKRSPRPKSTTSCFVEECRANWFTTTWSECSETCGENAAKTRDVRCYHGNQTSDRCNINDKPQTTERCFLRPCPTQEDDSCHGDRIENCHLLVPDLCRQTYYSSQCCATCQRKLSQGAKEP